MRWGEPSRHPVPLEVRERRVRELLERLAEAIARAGYGEVPETGFLAAAVADQVRSFAMAYRDAGAVVEPEFGDAGQAVAHFPAERSAPILAELLVHDRSVVRAAGVAMETRQSWLFRVETDGSARRIERLSIDALAGRR